MRPSKEQLIYINREEIVKKFNVSDKTVIRWLKHYGIFDRKGRKLNLNKAKNIRSKHKNGISIKELAKEYEVTFSTISRVVNNITYKNKSTYANVSVVYNPD